MALPVNIEDLLNRNKIEGNRIEFKKGWNPADIYHTICAFANDIDNLGGGYILVGVEQDENGVAKRPVLGIQTERVDGILKEMIGYNNKISPFYLPRTSVEPVDGKDVLVIWVPNGVWRPYSVRVDVTSDKNPKEEFYVRAGSSSIVAKGEVLDELRDLASRVPFDNMGNPEIKEDDIDVLLIRDYLRRAKSKMHAELKNMDTMEILDSMDLLVGPTERRMIKNVAAMMFCDHPEKFFPYTQISVVIFHEGLVENPNRFTEKTFKGSVPEIIRGALKYINDMVIQEYVSKPGDRPESDRWFNYPYQAVEEGVVNSMYHRDYRAYQEVEIAIEPHEMRILSISGPDRSIPMSAIREARKLHARRYRNSRLGDFLKELDMTEGRCTGIPTIQDELAKNGSPRAKIETDEDRSYFLLTLPVHERALQLTPVIGVQEVGQTGGQTNEQKGEQKGEQNTFGEQKDEQNTFGEQKDEQKIEVLLNILKQSPTITRTEISRLLGLTDSSAQRLLKKLKDSGRIVRVGGKKQGYWQCND